MKFVSAAMRSSSLNIIARCAGFESRPRRRLALTAACLTLSMTPVALADPVSFVNPPNIDYTGGVVELHAAPAPVSWAGQTVTTNVYSAKYGSQIFLPSYAPPTIRIDPAKTSSLHLDLMNDIDQLKLPCVTDHGFTNFHYHGFEVPPKTPGDDVISIKVHKGETFNYVVPFPQIPGKEHPEGMYWYHPHPHGCSNAQVNDGLSGAFIIGDILKSRYPKMVGVPEHILLLKDGVPTRELALAQQAAILALAANPKAPLAVLPRITVNGLDKPRISTAPGQYHFFRIGNVGSNAFVKIAMPGVVADVIAADGMPTQKTIPLDSTTGWILPPGSRVEILALSPKEPGTYEVRSLAIPASFNADEVLATLEVEAPTTAKNETATSKDQFDALLSAPAKPSNYYPSASDFAKTNTSLPCVINTPSGNPAYTFIFSGPVSSKFLMNGKEYEENRVDVSCPIPSNPTWTVHNDTGAHHTFHIHQIHFHVDKVVYEDGTEHVLTEDDAPIRDNVDVPPHATVTLTLPFEETYLAGKFVMHCHILAHEDRGMMMNIELVVVPKNGNAQ